MAVTLDQIKAELASLQALLTQLVTDVSALPVTPPPAPPMPPPTPTESASGTILTGAAGQIIDANKAVWTLVTGTGFEVRQNGLAAGFSANVTTLLYWNHTVYQSNGSGWWNWLNNAWTGAADPRVIPAPPPGPPSPSPAAGPGPAVSGSFVNVEFAKVTGKKIVRELFGVSTATMLDYNFALCNNQAFQTASKSLNVPLLRFNCNSGASGGNVWANTWRNVNAPDWSVVAPVINNLWKIVDLSTTKIIMGFGGTSGASTDANGWSVQQFASLMAQTVTHFRNTPGGNGKPINPKYWEVMNEPGISAASYVSYFNAAADAVHAIDPSYVVSGPCAPNNPGYVNTLIGGTNSSRLGLTNNHVYLYCPGPDPVPSDYQICQAQTGGSGTSPETFASTVNSSISGNFAANIPYFCGEYNIGCGPSDTNNREQSILGAPFAASFVMKMATNANAEMWAGLWEYGTSGGWGTMDGSGANIDPAAYFLSQACTVFPGALVAASTASGTLSVWATVNGGTMAVMLVNYGTTAVSGPVALSHWPINTSGNSTIHRWEISAANKKGIISSVAVSGGLTTSVQVPGQSVVLLYP